MTLLTAFPRDPPHKPRNLWQGLKLVANMATYVNTERPCHTKA